MHKPFHKSNIEIRHIQKESSHSPSIKKQLPLPVKSRLSRSSSDENMFIQAAPVYQEALKQFGYNHITSYKNKEKDSKNSRNNKIINNNNNNNNDSKNDNNNNLIESIIRIMIIAIFTRIILIVMIIRIIITRITTMMTITICIT